MTRCLRQNAYMVRRIELVGVGLAVAFGALSACRTDYQEGADDPRYGSPNILEKLGPPEGVAGEPATTDGGGTGSLKCGNPVEPGPCTVTFKEILAALETGDGKCSTIGCHGGQNPQNQPAVIPEDPSRTWTLFEATTLSDGKRYINPCSKDPKLSGLACNLYAMGTCGSHMPQVGGQIPQEVITKIETWLACGSPNN